MTNEQPTTIRVAVPVADGVLCPHFGHCDVFAIIDADQTSKAILKTTQVVPPPHEPGLLPRWLADQGVSVIIAGGMGGRAQALFAERRIAVVVGAPVQPPDALVTAWLAGKLATGSNTCDH
jgi:ATP-binding protein involved in chromosome partitioning